MWKEIKKPFFVLAPMDDVTNAPFRRIIESAGAPELAFTEFVSVDGLNSAGADRLEHKLLVDPKENPPIVQLWGQVPENYTKAAKKLSARGHFAGIDINMGCPVQKVIKKGNCSALINNRPLAAEIIAATKEGAGDLPVSVKCRVGWSEIDLSWIEFLLKQDIAALSVHTRTTKEQSKVPAHHDLLPEIVVIRDRIAPQTLIVANGDILSRQQGEDLAEETGVDGVMIGRGIFQNPYLFSGKKITDVSKEELMYLYKSHVELFQSSYPGVSVVGLRRLAKMYINGFDGASELRTRIMEVTESEDLIKIIAKS